MARLKINWCYQSLEGNLSLYLGKDKVFSSFFTPHFFTNLHPEIIKKYQNDDLENVTENKNGGEYQLFLSSHELAEIGSNIEKALSSSEYSSLIDKLFIQKDFVINHRQLERKDCLKLFFPFNEKMLQFKLMEKEKFIMAVKSLIKDKKLSDDRSWSDYQTNLANF